MGKHPGKYASPLTRLHTEFIADILNNYAKTININEGDLRTVLIKRKAIDEIVDDFALSIKKRKNLFNVQKFIAQCYQGCSLNDSGKLGD